MRTRTTPQQSQQVTRERNGRYAQSEPCEACGKPAGFDYWSSSGHAGRGLTLCHRVRCPANVMVREYPADYAERIEAHIMERMAPDCSGIGCPSCAIGERH